MKKKRSLMAELTEGCLALADQRTGKRTLRTHVVQTKATPKMSAKELSALRERMNLSRALFAKYLRTNVRTLENWEQGRARPNAQAALLIRMVERYPDTVRDWRRSDREGIEHDAESLSIMAFVNDLNRVPAMLPTAYFAENGH